MTRDAWTQMRPQTYLHPRAFRTSVDGCVYNLAYGCRRGRTDLKVINCTMRVVLMFNECRFSVFSF